MTPDLDDTGPDGTAQIVQIGDERYRRAILADHIRHLIMPGTDETPCCEAVGARWLLLEAGRDDRGVPSTCRRPRHGFEELLAHVLGGPDPDLADEVCRTGHERAAANRHRR